MMTEPLLIEILHEMTTNLVAVQKIWLALWITRSTCACRVTVFMARDRQTHEKVLHFPLPVVNVKVFLFTKHVQWNIDLGTYVNMSFNCANFVFILDDCNDGVRLFSPCPSKVQASTCNTGGRPARVHKKRAKRNQCEPCKMFDEPGSLVDGNPKLWWCGKEKRFWTFRAKTGTWFYI